MITWWGWVRRSRRVDPVDLAGPEHLRRERTGLSGSKRCWLGLKHRRHRDVVVDCPQLEVRLPVLVALNSLVGLIKELVSCRGLSVGRLDLSEDRRHR